MRVRRDRPAVRTTARTPQAARAWAACPDGNDGPLACPIRSAAGGRARLTSGFARAYRATAPRYVTQTATAPRRSPRRTSRYPVAATRIGTSSQLEPSQVALARTV